ncbi:uncharacterized protein LOC130809020 isoform X1 [Amaranthus tricolor]|uniref:uncharacterized protein LOC130809020 isoform X1 n=1 Tax=Amaranthus tricolor TaxID=29722 RepID=UPI00258E7AC6|nr:uncharacterized protein LOC130809020 isoform X1 [Amaranthus tricolor]
MVKRFFNGGSTPSNSIVNDALITLLSGPPSCGKTSLLFQFAFNVVVQSESQGYVVFICNRRRFQTKPPFLSQGIDDSSPIFERIQIKYLDDYDDEGLKKYFSAFHLLNPFPLAVIIDDFGDFFLDSKCQQRYNNPRGRDLAMVRVLALSHSAIFHANKTASCQLLLSDTHHGDSPRLLFLYKRWVSSIFTIQGESQGSGSFYLKHRVHAAGSDSRKMSAKYSIALQYLVLEGIVEDDAHL